MVDRRSSIFLLPNIHEPPSLLRDWANTWHCAGVLELVLPLTAQPEGRDKSSPPSQHRPGIVLVVHPAVAWAATWFLDSRTWVELTGSLYPWQLVWPIRGLFVEWGSCCWALYTHDACFSEVLPRIALGWHQGWMPITAWSAFSYLSFIQKVQTVIAL